MTPESADVRYVRLNRALHDLATAIDTAEHAGTLIDKGSLRGQIATDLHTIRVTVTSLQRELEYEVADQ